MSWFESNGKILSRNYPGLLEDLKRRDDLLPEEDIQIEDADSKTPSLKICGIYIHSPRNPEREALRLAESAKTGAGPVIILGFGLGYAAQAVAEAVPDRPIVIVEKYRNLFLKALEYRNMETLLSREKLIFVPGSSVEGIAAALSVLSQMDTDSPAPVIIRNQALASLDEEWYAAVENRIRTWAMKDGVNEATLRRFGKRWVRNLSRNIMAIRDLPGIAHLAGFACKPAESPLASAAHVRDQSKAISVSPAAGTDCIAQASHSPAQSEAIPVFLAAAGPSLDSAGPLLHEIHRRCITVAVDTSLRFFIKNGICPDFVITTDPQYWNSRHIDRPCSQTILIAESAVYPPALRLPFKGKFLCGSLFPLGGFIEKRVDPKGRLGSGGSVATTAWDFARTLGAKDIWIAGLDLAYPGLKTHFRGALFEDKTHCESRRTKPSETWLNNALRDGLPFLTSGFKGQVLTDRRLSLYAAWFENRFSQYSDVCNHCLFPGGLSIAGLEASEPEELYALPVIREEIDKRLTHVLDTVEAEFNSTEEKRARHDRYSRAVSLLVNGLEFIKAEAEKGLSLSERSLKYTVNKDEQNKILKKLDEITGNIKNSEVKEVAGFLFPQNEALEMDKESGDPFRVYLKSSARLFSALTAATAENLSCVKKQFS